MTADTLRIVMPDGTSKEALVLHLGVVGTFAVVKLAGTPYKGTMDVFHVGTGLRATPPRHFSAITKLPVAKALCAWLEDLDPVTVNGTLRIDRGEYHRVFSEWVAANART